jgi:hypothetical protein
MNTESATPPKHPSLETLVSHCYEDLPSSEQAAVTAHLESCSSCRDKVGEFRSVGMALDQWRVKSPTPVRSGRRAFLEWGLAAGVVLGIGIGIGRFTAPTLPSVEQLTSELMPRVQAQLAGQIATTVRSETGGLRESLKSDFQQIAAGIGETNRTENRELLSAFAQEWASLRTQDQSENLALLTRIEQSRKNDYVRLRRDLETIALSADQGIAEAQYGIYRLAQNSPAHNVPSPSSGPQTPAEATERNNP